MPDTDCIAFLQWALPQLNFRWLGFRKVRRQVCKRVRHRMRRLGLSDFAAYRARLQTDPSEWRALDASCHITISRFFRDRGVFEAVRNTVLPAIAAQAKREGRVAQVWSAGCAAGEEPYTVKILWDTEIAPACPGVTLAVTATDIDDRMLARAHQGCFESSSLHELPPLLIEAAFDRIGPLYCVKPKYRDGVTFLRQDIRTEMPDGPFDLILCRYVVFTYFAEPLQHTMLAGMLARLRPAGFLVIGTHEHLPSGAADLVALAGAPQIFRKRSAI
jgi:chemotaxis protein methyltransferase CheR